MADWRQRRHNAADWVTPPAEPGHHAPQQYRPTALLGTYFYSPSEEGYEASVKDRLERWRAAQEAALGLTDTATLPALSEDEVLSIRRCTARRPESE